MLNASGTVLTDLLTILGLSGLVFFLSQFLQLVQQRSLLEAGLFEVPAAVGAIISGLAAGVIARRTSVRGTVCGGLAAVGLALAACTVIAENTSAFYLVPALFLAGLGSGLSFTVTADVVLSSVPKNQAGAAAGVSETAYELGAALGIALLGSIVTGVYRSFTTPPDTPTHIDNDAHDSLGGAIEASNALPQDQAAAMLNAARDAFTDGFQTAACVSAAALTMWYMLRDQKLDATTPTHS